MIDTDAKIFDENGEPLVPNNLQLAPDPTESEIQQDTNALLAAMEALEGFGTADAGVRKFMESEHANNVWLRQRDGTHTRGIPGKLPFEMSHDPYLATESSFAYWAEYGFRRTAPVITITTPDVEG